MHRFAHLADVHLGASREPQLRRMELQAFDSAMTACIEAKVDFVLACGDIFHVGIPDLSVVNSAVRSMMRAQEAGIPIYAIYGSHDYTPNGTSVIDILDTAGVLTNVFRPELEGDKMKLGFVTDEKTGAKVAGISARKIGLESRYYEILDRAALEAEYGFKVFLFHSGLTELKSDNLREMETIDVGLLPRGFDYYAGGHIHERGEYDLEGHDNIVFPGPLSIGHGADLEATARGEKRGIYIVEFDDAVRRKRFVPVGDFSGVFREFDLTGLNAPEAGARIREVMQAVDVEGKLVVLKAFGELSGGRVSDVGFATVREELSARGALHVYLSRNSLRSMEVLQEVAVGQDPAGIEKALFEKGAGRVKVSFEGLRGEKGPAAAVELLKLMRQQPKLGEAKRDYVQRMVDGGRKTLGVEEVPQR